jgi:predicted amino acid racemase
MGRNNMYPALKVDLRKVKENVSLIKEKCDENSIDIMCVTKAFCALPEISQAVIDGGCTMLADSRVQNLKKHEKLNAKKVLMRIPMMNEIEDV